MQLFARDDAMSKNIDLDPLTSKLTRMAHLKKIVKQFVFGEHILTYVQRCLCKGVYALGNALASCVLVLPEVVSK